MKMEISNNPHLLPPDDEGNRPFPSLQASRTRTPSEEQKQEQASYHKPFNAVVHGGQTLIQGPHKSSYRYKSDRVFSTSQEIVSPRSQRSQMNLPSSAFHGGFRQPLGPPPSPCSPCLPSYPLVRIPYGTYVCDNNYWGRRPIVNYCPAESNRNYYRREIFRSHPHGEHDNNSSIRVTHHAYLVREFIRPLPLPSPPTLPYAVSQYSYLSPIHVGVPFIVPGPSSPRPLSPPHMHLPRRPPAVTVLVVKQIDHYFSEENLETDHHLKSLMDDQGWVHVDQIVKFHRVSNLTHNITLILKSLIARSRVVEVKDKSMRRRNGWEKWVKKSDDRASNNS